MPPPQSGFPLPAAQTLTYEVDWRLFPAATATIHLDQQGNAERITVSAATLGAISVLYRVNDHFQSIFDRTTGCSTSYSKQAEEGRRRVNTDLHFDYPNKRQLLSEKNLVRNTAKQQSGSIPGCVTDVLSAMFYIATQPLTVGNTFYFPLADSMRTVSVGLKAEAKEPVTVPAGKFPAIRVQPVADAGVVKNRGQIWLWYSDDPRHIPVQMKARLFWGTLTLKLTSVENK